MDDSTPIKLEQYNFQHENRGLCLIINNHRFDYGKTGQRDRVGTDVDAEACENQFMRLGYSVTRHDDLGKWDMVNVLDSAAREDHSNADSFACIILSHGEDGWIYGTDGKMRTDRLMKEFKGDTCPTLAGKPKLFFFQACRGARFDFGTELAEDEVDAAVPVDANVRRIPVEADFLLAYSVVPGHFSWRNNVDGSWFIQALVRVLSEYADELEIMSMMTLVNNIVAYRFTSCTDDDFTSNMKQMPCIVSMLTKQVFFKPKY